MLLINKTLLKMSKGFRGYIALIALLKLLTLAGIAMFAQSISGFLGGLFDPGSVDFRESVRTAFVSAVIILISEVLIGDVEYRCTAKSRIVLRERIFSKILLLDVGNIEKMGTTHAVAAAVDGIEAMQIYYSKYLPGLIYCAISPFYLFWKLKEASFTAALFLLIVSLILLPANNFFRSVVRKLKDSYWVSFLNLTGYYLESLYGLTTIMLFGRDRERAGILETKTGDFCRKIMGIMRLNFKAFLFSDLVIYSSVFITVLMVTAQLSKGEISLASALLTLMLGYGFFGSIRILMHSSHQALAGVAASQNLSRIFDIDTGRPSKPFVQKEESDGFVGIRLENVEYSYEDRDGVLNNVSIDIERGKTTALVGQSGSGKTTVSGILMRFFDPQSGEIRFEGTDYACYEPGELRKKIIMVPQFVSIFSGTIEDNLLVAKPDATIEEMHKALELARLKDWVTGLPDGLKTDVGDAGAKLSGGQRQKIGIARVLLGNAQYIIFDEATSSVDFESEREIWACIGELSRMRTLVVISHRLSTIRRADRIYVLSGGKVAERGSHEKLMEQNGIYTNLVSEQAVLEARGVNGEVAV
ncbi:ABC transporter ATP-binding protein [Desulfocucumis palustris]|uniref:ABC transporter ATP-binding protein n=1 Tax=Desulfocucumis palustris TaxID=1898651 RepID=A0A2L2XGW5_9FIRM|nr:ATP-binding cassette domain-containing protein [Desulfocucumis palustris]GBF33121.1 ABC transporter ATP-binding protein [Desulfocucumis palustris]